jgi:TolA-binding protein
MRKLVVILIPLVLFSCSRVSEEELHRQATSAYEEKNFSEAAIRFEELIKEFPKGQFTEESLFILASVYGDNMGDYEKGIATYRRLREMFPNGSKAPAALFLIGFVYNNHLNNLDSARIAYEEFLTQYRDHEMATSARFELDNLGKSPDELLKPAIVEKPEKLSPSKSGKK